MVIKKIVASVMAVATLAMAFAGCGKKESNKFVVGFDQEFPPMGFVADDGSYVGFDLDLAKEAAKRMDKEFVAQPINWDAKDQELKSGNIDCIWNGFTANVADDDDGVQRAQKVDFSYNYMENRQVIVVKKDSGIKTAADLSGKQGAAESGSAGEGYGKSFEGATIKGFLKQTDCLFEVKSGTAAFCVLDAQLAKSYCGKGDYADLEIVDDLSSDVEYYAIGFKKGSELTAEVNKQLEKLAKDGTIAALGEKYGVANTVITDFSDQK